MNFSLINIGLGFVVAMVLLAALSYVSDSAKNAVRKFQLGFRGFLAFWFSSDRSWSKQPDPDLIKDSQSKSVRLIFIRHGESTWNDIFNKGFGFLGFGFVTRLVMALLRETSMFFSPDSTFFDSPLSPTGHGQARNISQFLKENAKTKTSDLEALRGDTESIIVSSNLRRAIATVATGLEDRVTRTGEKIHLLSDLQEISRNVDCVAFAPANASPFLDLGTRKLKQNDPLFVTGENRGDKAVRGCGLDRLQAFAAWALRREERTVIVGGHSLYFREFFKTFLPHSSTHKAKKKKMLNCGIVGLTLHEGETSSGDLMYRIDPESIDVVLGGFKK